MSAIVDIIVPVFGMVLVGWLIGRSKLLTPEGLRGFTAVTFYALFPALLFRSMAKVRLETLEPQVLLAFFSGVMLLYGGMMVLGRMQGMRLGDRAMFALSGSFSNGVGIGIPFISYGFGEQGLVPLLMIISVHSLILLTFTCFLMEMDGEGGRRGQVLKRLGGAALSMLKHPVIPAIFAGLLWGEITTHTSIATPAVIDRILQAFAAAAPPCGLIMVGASLAHVGLKGHWQSAAVRLGLQVGGVAGAGLDDRPLRLSARSAVAECGNPERGTSGRRQRLPDRPDVRNRRRPRDQRRGHLDRRQRLHAVRGIVVARGAGAVSSGPEDSP